MKEHTLRRFTWRALDQMQPVLSGVHGGHVVSTREAHLHESARRSFRVAGAQDEALEVVVGEFTLPGH